MLDARASIFAALLAAPCIHDADVLACASVASPPRDWEWPPFRSIRGHIKKYGCVYFGRTGDALIKIGFSMTPDLRMLAQHLAPLLVIAGAQPHHEKAMHRLFAAELAHGREHFAGPRVEAFVACGRARSTWVLRKSRYGRQARISEALLLDPLGEGRTIKQRMDRLTIQEEQRFAHEAFRRRSRVWFRRATAARQEAA